MASCGLGNNVWQSRSPASSTGAGAKRFGRPLPALSRTPLAARFVSWQGFTGKSYVFSAYPSADCPAFSDAIVVAVARNDRGNPRVVAVFDTGAFPEPVMTRAAREFGLRRNGGELHVHLLARTACERREALADLEAAFELLLEHEAS